MNQPILVDLADVSFEQDTPSDLKNLIQVVQSFNITEVEPELAEDLKCTDLQEGKYYFLAALRGVFVEFKKLGDTALTVKKGSCGVGCYPNCPSVYQFEGNHSKETFAFVVEELDNQIKGLHFCAGFVGDDGVPGDNYYHFMYIAASKLAEMKRRKLG